MKTNKLLSLILCAVAIFSIPVIVFAHPGRTDEYGGHYDWKTGEYHYHHGYPAHQHIDGYCPYDYDDQTDHSNHGGGVSNSTQEKHHGSSTTETETKKELTFFETIICSLAISALFLGPLVGTIMLLIRIMIASIFFKIYEILGICGDTDNLLVDNILLKYRIALDFLLTFAYLVCHGLKTPFNEIGKWDIFLLYTYIALCCIVEFIIILSPLISYFKYRLHKITKIHKKFGNKDLDRVVLKEKSEDQAQKREQEYTNIIEQERKNPAITAEETEQTPEIVEETVEKEEQPPEEVAQEEPKPTIEPTRKIYHYHTQSHIMPVDPKHVYWTANGKSFHSNRMCLALRNHTTVSSGTLTKAQRLGHKTPCSVCVGKNYKVKKK